MRKFFIRDREAGNEMEVFLTEEEAEFELKLFEDADRKEGIFTEDKYEIIQKDFFTFQEYRDRCGVGSEKDFDKLADAIAFAEEEWDHLSRHDKNSYLEGEYAYFRITNPDGNISWDSVEVEKQKLIEKDEKPVCRAWKVWGKTGHTQRESYSSSYKFDFSKNGNTRILEVLNCDKTNTNDYSIVKITRNTSKECEAELQGQLSDGVFENSAYGLVEEIDAADNSELDFSPERSEAFIDDFDLEM